MNPIPHGIRPGFKLTKDDCQVYKVLDLFCVLPVEHWADLEKVISEMLKADKSLYCDAKTAKGILQKSLIVIGKKRKDCYPLRTFCDQLVSYYRSKYINKTFATIWIQKQQLSQEKMRAINVGARNGVRLSTVGAIQFGEELEASIEQNLGPSKQQQESQQQRNLQQKPQQQEPQEQQEPREQQDRQPQQNQLQRESVVKTDESTDELLSYYIMLEEHDAFYFQDSTLGTRIKRAALHIFKSWKNGMELTDMQRYWMKCGLSSILDLVNPKSTRAFLHSDEEDWHRVESKFTLRHRITHPSLPDIFDQTYDVVAALLEKHNDIEKAINYIRLVKTSSTETKKKLNVISTVIHILESNAFLLNPDNLHRVTEYDFITQIWSPLLKSIIDVHGILRLKIGESSPCHGTMSRKRIYQQVNVGFKVDIRILYDSRHNEHDLLASEVAKAGSSSKINGDLTKLFREAKDNLDDCIQHLLNEKTTVPSSWFLQANNLHAHLGTVHLTEPGLYAAIHQGIIHFPRNLSSFHDFKQSLTLLFTMISDLERNATMIRKSIDCIDDRGSTIGTTISRQDSWMTGCRLASAIRPTYYDPPADDVNLAQLPRALFGSLSAVASPISCGGSRSPSPGGADDYGWMPKDGKFYNIYTKSIADRHPFSDISNTT